MNIFFMKLIESYVLKTWNRLFVSIRFAIVFEIIRISIPIPFHFLWNWKFRFRFHSTSSIFSNFNSASIPIPRNSGGIHGYHKFCNDYCIFSNSHVYLYCIKSQICALKAFIFRFSYYIFKTLKTQILLFLLQEN